MTTTAARTRRWTYADYCRIPPDRKRHEIIDGRHFVQSTPPVVHQVVVGRLAYEFTGAIDKPRLGAVFLGPVDVHLGPSTVVQPDIVVLRPRSASSIGDKKLTGVPDLIVEVLAPARIGYDRRTKRERYERAGVREFWLVDPEAHTIDQLVLRRGRYESISTASERITLRILRGVTIDLGEVW